MAAYIEEIIEAIETVAPTEYAADWDRVGLQIGSSRNETDAVVVTLDVRENTLETIRESGAGLVIAHHPLIFSPIRQLHPEGSPGKEVFTFIENGTALYVAHTNVDVSPVLSMNLEIGKRLPLEDFGPAVAKPQPPSLKLVTFVPEEALEQVRANLSSAGAGEIGEYRECSFSHRGIGSFRGSSRSNPTIGERGVLEEVEEYRLEMVCPKSRLDHIIRALWQAHPYEEVAYDLYPLSGYQGDFHFLWRGTLAEPWSLRDLSAHIKECLGAGIAPVRFAGEGNREIRTLAWCSGGGKGLIPSVSRLGVDAYLTGDTGHHDALDCLSRGFCLIDLDHFYTERFFVDGLGHYLAEEFGDRIRIIPDTSGPVYHAG